MERIAANDQSFRWCVSVSEGNFEEEFRPFGDEDGSAVQRTGEELDD